MKLSIYEVYVPIENQEQADRMLALCKEYNLPYWNNFNFGKKCIFTCDEDKDFFIMCSKWNINHFKEIKTKATEQEFINLLKETI